MWICAFITRVRKVPLSLTPPLSLSIPLFFLFAFARTAALSTLFLALSAHPLWRSLSHLPLISICLIARHRSQANIIKEMHQPVASYHLSIAAMVKAMVLNLVCMSVVCGRVHTLLFGRSYAMIIKTLEKANCNRKPKAMADLCWSWYDSNADTFCN